MDAARQFVGIARPPDRVAIYALAESFFQVISPLTARRMRLVQLIEGMPPLGGTSPLYDAVVMAYAQEALPLSKERTVLVVITDSIDNALYAPAGGSRTPTLGGVRRGSGDRSGGQAKDAATGGHELGAAVHRGSDLQPGARVSAGGWVRPSTFCTVPAASRLRCSV